MGLNRVYQRGLFFKVWGPNGREVRPFTTIAPPPERDGDVAAVREYRQLWKDSGMADAAKVRTDFSLQNPISEFGDIVPYWPGTPSAAHPGDAQGLRPHRDSDDLPPGTSVESDPSILAPMRKVAGTRTEMGDDGNAHYRLGHEFVPAPAPPGVKPVPGFQILTGYTFDTPGVYRIQTYYSMEGVVAKRVHPRVKGLPGPVLRVLAMLSRLPGLNVLPDPSRIDLSIKATSETAEFEVRP
jgi:hypothetical protein